MSSPPPPRPHDAPGVSAWASLSLIFTVTSGRSGTKLLTVLLRDCLGIDAEHEPAPRFNFVLRSILDDPVAAMTWLHHEKLPAIAARCKGPVYVETSHLVCKGFIEPILELGLRPRFIILTRPAPEVARSLFQMNVIPERTRSGRLVLLGPTDRGVLPLPGWERFSDYQLCFWYAREIERRQAHYRSAFAARGLASFDIDMHSLADGQSFDALCHFVAGEASAEYDKGRFAATLLSNQNSRASIVGDAGDRELPGDALEQELALDSAVSASR